MSGCHGQARRNRRAKQSGKPHGKYPANAPPATEREIAIALPAIEIGIPSELPLPGSATAQLKVISEHPYANRYEVTFEAPGGTAHDLPVRLNRHGVHTSGADLAGSTLLRFPEGHGYRRAKVTFTW